jgi:hypothetical protein
VHGTAQNYNLVSPKFTPIILEACSLIESVFKRSTTGNGRLTLKPYAELLEPNLELADATTIFLSHSLRFLRPFQNWHITVPSWWTAYNQLKHDRMSNWDAASYSATVDALAGVHQVLSRSKLFLECIAKAGWLNEEDEHISELMTCNYVGCGPPQMPAESILFVSPIRDNFVIWNHDGPAIDYAWTFSERVKFHLWDYDERYGSTCYR